MRVFEGHHTCHRGTHSSAVHRDTAVNEMRRFPTGQGTGGGAHGCVLNEYLITATKAVQVKAYIVHRQGSSGSHAHVALALCLLKGDIATQGAFPGKVNILQGGIF